ncbi:MAG: hypothetical protein AB7O37_16790 [Vicinamibacteria bacterium]
MPRELIRPNPPVVNAVIESAVVPAIRDIEKDLGVVLPTVVTLWTPNMEGPKILVTGQGTLEAALAQAPKGEMRLSFRDTAVQGRLLYFGEAVYSQDLSPKTGFSGFDLRGVARLEGEHISIEDDSWTIKYKVWRFRGWR